MAIYAVSVNLLENLAVSEVSYLGSILFCFVNDQNDAKLAVDKNKEILSRYRCVKNNADIIKTWLDLISVIPSSIECVNTALDDEDDDEQICLKLCSATKGLKGMIVYSINSFQTTVDEECCICYGGHHIRLLDKDEAKKELNDNLIVSIKNSMVSGGNISNSTNSCNYEKE